MSNLSSIPKWDNYLYRFIIQNEENPFLLEDDFSNIFYELPFRKEQDQLLEILEKITSYNPLNTSMPVQSIKISNKEFGEYIESKINFIRNNYYYNADFILNNGILGNVTYAKKTFNIEDYTAIDVVFTFNSFSFSIFFVSSRIDDTIKKAIYSYLNDLEPDIWEFDSVKNTIHVCNEKVTSLDIFNEIEHIKTYLENIYIC